MGSVAARRLSTDRPENDSSMLGMKANIDLGHQSPWATAVDELGNQANTPPDRTADASRSAGDADTSAELVIAASGPYRDASYAAVVVLG